MSNYNIYIPATIYKKIQKKLQKYEIKIGGMNIRDFLVAYSNVDDFDNSLDTRIKRLVLHIAGDFDTLPRNLCDKIHLEKNLFFRYKEFILLRKRLDKMVKEYDQTARIMAAEVNCCLIIKDCLDLIKSKIKI